MLQERQQARIRCKKIMLSARQGKTGGCGGPAEGDLARTGRANSRVRALIKQH